MHILRFEDGTQRIIRGGEELLLEVATSTDGGVEFAVSIAHSYRTNPPPFEHGWVTLGAVLRVEAATLEAFYFGEEG